MTSPRLIAILCAICAIGCLDESGYSMAGEDSPADPGGSGSPGPSSAPDASPSPSPSPSPPMTPTSPPTDCAQTACFYVREGAAPSGDGATWTTAFSTLPATLTRGATYFLAGGSYPTYTFNTVESGTATITVKKASAADHGSDAGWAASYGMNQAVFASAFNITRGNFVIDGGYRNESDWFDGAAYGFKIQNTGNWQHMQIRDPAGQRPVSNITVKYIYIAAIIGNLHPTGNNHCEPTTYAPCAINTNTMNENLHNTGYLFSRVFVEGSNNPYFLRFLKDPILEYSASEKTSGSATWHGEVVNLYYASQGAGIVRFNHFRDCYNGASGFPAGGATGVIALAYVQGVQIYGNTIERFTVGDGAIAAGWSNDNLKIHHNTFVGGAPYADRPLIAFPQGQYTGTGNEAYNNLRVSTVQTTFVNGEGMSANNSAETEDVFVNYAGGDLHLARATSAQGRILQTPYNLDDAGQARGADGYIDIGAHEFVTTQ